MTGIIRTTIGSHREKTQPARPQVQLEWSVAARFILARMYTHAQPIVHLTHPSTLTITSASGVLRTEFQASQEREIQHITPEREKPSNLKPIDRYGTICSE